MGELQLFDKTHGIPWGELQLFDKTHGIPWGELQLFDKTHGIPWGELQLFDKTHGIPWGELQMFDKTHGIPWESFNCLTRHTASHGEIHVKVESIVEDETEQMIVERRKGKVSLFALAAAVVFNVVEIVTSQ